MHPHTRGHGLRISAIDPGVTGMLRGSHAEDSSVLGSLDTTLDELDELDRPEARGVTVEAIA